MLDPYAQIFEMTEYRCLCYARCRDPIRGYYFQTYFVEWFWIILLSVHDIRCKSVISRNIYSTCKLFGLSSGDFLNHKDLVGDERLFSVTVTEKERMYVEFARELIRLRDGYLSLSNGFVMSREDIQTVLNCVTTDSVFLV